MGRFVLAMMLVSTALAQQPKTAKLVDVRAFDVKNTPFVATNNGENPVLIDRGSYRMYTVTIAVDGFNLSANFPETKHLHPPDWIVGDPITVAIDKDLIVILDDKQKPVKRRIIRRERIEVKP